MTSANRILRRIGLALCLSPLLAACTGEVITSDTSGIHRSEIRLLTMSTGNAEILGSPPDRSSPAVVANSFRMPMRSGDVRFSPVEPGSRDVRIVVAFGSRGDINSMCTQPPGGGDTDLPLLMSVTYCNGTRGLSNATVRSADIRGPSDPRWEQVTGRVMQTLLWPRPQELTDARD